MELTHTRKAPAWQQRQLDLAIVNQLINEGLSPLLARVYGARGVKHISELEAKPIDLLRPDSLMGIDAATDLLCEAITQQHGIVVAADYDCDGATACAIAIKGLRLMGVADELLKFVVPDRVKMGYGLSPALAELAARVRPKPESLLITVDNGIASYEGIEKAIELGFKVLVTDHHLPGALKPAAHAIVNPNQYDCQFPSKSLCGAGTVFYVLLALRAKLRERGLSGGDANLQELLDLVALGTVADLVPLDRNNRILVQMGLNRIRHGHCQPGLQAILQLAGKSAQQFELRDFGFTVGPRINAAGRLGDMSVGIRCLLSNSYVEALEFAQALEKINSERKEVHSAMLEQAQLPTVQPMSHCLVVYDDSWHQGVVGLVASRLKDSWHCPSFALAPSEPGSTELRGSGRSIMGLHLRDALDFVDKQHPGLLERFGGHAMAAGITLQSPNLNQFSEALNRAIEHLCAGPLPGAVLLTDGPAQATDITLENGLALKAGGWGQRFDAPIFEFVATVRKQQIIKEKHLKLWVYIDGQPFEAIYFFNAEPAPATCLLAAQMSVDSFRGVESVTLIIQKIRPIAG